MADDIDDDDWVLTDERIAEIARQVDENPCPRSACCKDGVERVQFALHIVAKKLLAEVLRHRSARAADEERVREVAREAVAHWFRWSTSLDGVDVVEFIATRAAKQLATAGVRLSDDEAKQLRHHIEDHNATCGYSCSIIERLLATRSAP